MEAIKPCPFCGASEVSVVAIGHYRGREDSWTVECGMCGADGPHEQDINCPEWNALPRPEPWLDIPDGPGWWLYEPDTSDAFPVWVDKPSWAKELMCSWFIPWVSMRNQELSNMPKGKWKRIDMHQPPKEGE